MDNLIRHAAFCFSFVLALIMLLHVSTSVSNSSLIEAHIASFVFIVSLILVVNCSPERLLSPAAGYLLLLGIFHLGAAIPACYGWGTSPSEYPWMRAQTFPRSLSFCSLAFAWYTAGATLSSIVFLKRKAGPNNSPLENRNLKNYGFTLFFFGLILMWYGAASTGMLNNTYSNYFEADLDAEHRLFGYGNRILLTGMVVAAVGCSAKKFNVLIACILISYGPFFLFGIRGQLILHMYAILIILAFKDYGKAKRLALAMFLAVIILAPIVKIIRSMQTDSFIDALHQSNPSDMLFEAGGSLRPLVETLDELQVRGSDFWYGKSYFMAIWRAVPFSRLADDSPGHWITAITDRWTYEHGGTIGFSAVAEPYLNFGWGGIVCYFSAIGFIITTISKYILPYSIRTCCIILVFTNLLWTARNDMVNFTYSTAWSAIILLAIYFVHKSAPLLRQEARP